jgi:DNA polymerase I-like protein with 3'-5' exonuclease and polymerase domains
MCDWIPPTELPDLRGVDVIALDTETHDRRLTANMGSGWPFADGHICGISVAYRAGAEIRAHYFPLRHPDTDNFDPACVYRWLHDLIQSDVHIVTQNGLYDYGWLRAEAGIKMPPGERIEEIGALATLVDENRFKYSLDSLCEWRGLSGKHDALLRQGIKALELVSNKRKKLVPQTYIWQLPARYVGLYAEGDTVGTLLLYQNLNPFLDLEGTRAAYRLECDILPMVHEMRRRGIRLDLDAAAQARDLLLGKRDAALAALSEQLGCAISMHEIQGRKWLVDTFDRFKIKYPRTENGNPSFTAGKLGWMAGHAHWLPQLIAVANKYGKAGGDFVQKLIDHAVNGRIHAEINPHRSESNGTKSFRFSYNDPPLQQMPSRDEELAPLIRGIFLSEVGEVWAQPDASQQEFRFVVHYANQHRLRKAAEAVARYHSDPDTDFHQLAATITTLERKDAKAVNFAKIYGAGVKLFAQMIGKPLAEAQAIYERYDRELPFLHQLSRIYTNKAHRQGFITLYDGARRHFNRFSPGGKWKKRAGPCEWDEAQQRIKDPRHPWYGRKQLYRADAHTALNALIQGSAARHTKLWMRACWREGIVPLLQMHDALECSVNSREQADLVASLGEQAVELDVPMRVDLKFGRSWGDATYSWEELHQSAASKVVSDAVKLTTSDVCDDAAEMKRGATWAIRDHDVPADLATEAAQEEGAEGHLYHRVVYDGHETYVPQDELHEAVELVTSNAAEPTVSPLWEEPALVSLAVTETPYNNGSGGNGHAGNGYTAEASGSHGETGSKKGSSIASWIYVHPELPKYLKVDKHVAANGERHFYQHHWNGERWVYGVKGTYAEEKIPYRLPELLAAPPTEPVWICEGEKDADNVAALGLVATTNPGGAKQFQPELAPWFRGKQTAFIFEDNDEAGREHTRKVVAALSGIVPSIGVVAFPELAEKGDVSDWLEQGGNKQLLLARAEQALKRGPASETIEPVDLWGQFDPPALPVGLLPNVIERFAFEEGEITGADPSGFAMAALAVCAAALPDHTQLQVKRHDPHWLEAARLWVGLIGNPSTKKTPIILRAAKPLKRLDAELWRGYLAAKACYDALSSEERKQVERPKQRRLRLEDTTIEAAQEVLKDSPDGVLCIQDELAGWFGAMDKYAGRGATKDRGFWLQSFHGGPYALNRIARGAAMIENLSVSLLGGIQPDPIRKIAEDTVDDGLLQRLVPIVLRRGKAGRDAPSGQAAVHYDDLIVRLHEHPFLGAPLEFDDAALGIRTELEQKHLDLMAYEAINRKLAAHIGKYDGLFARLCLLWHCIDGTEGLIITEHTACRVAGFMGRFLLPHATAFYAGMLALSDDHDRLTNVAGYILAKKLSRITNRDVQHGNRVMRGLERQEIENVFAQLEALGWLMPTSGSRWSAPLHWQVNPEVHCRFAQRAKREASERVREREMLQEMFGASKSLENEV